MKPISSPLRWPTSDPNAAAPDGSPTVSIDGVSTRSSETVRQGLTQCLARLWRYAWVLSRRADVADDLVQATCVRALERAAQYQADTRLDRWLFSILHSIWVNDLRANRVRQGQGSIDTELLRASHDSNHLEAQILASQVMRQVAELPEAQRVTLFLAYVEGLSYREVAQVLQIPIGTVMSRLATARARLADALGTTPVPGGIL